MKFYGVIAFAAVIASAIASSCLETQKKAGKASARSNLEPYTPSSKKNGDYKPFQCQTSTGESERRYSDDLPCGVSERKSQLTEIGI